jgi:cell wall-associated NlpC family hydrolase
VTAPVDPDVFYPPGSFFLTRIGGRTGWWVGTAQAVCGMPSRWTHAGVVLGGGTIIQAQPGGAVIAPLADLLRRPHVVSDAPVRLAVAQFARGLSHPLQVDAYEHDLRADVVDAARAFEGIPYSFADYAALAALHLHAPSTRLRRYVQASGHLICSALVDRVYSDVGIHLYDDGRYPGDVTPADLDAWAQDHFWKDR